MMQDAKISMPKKIPSPSIGFKPETKMKEIPKVASAATFAASVSSRDLNYIPDTNNISTEIQAVPPLSPSNPEKNTYLSSQIH